MLRQGIFIPNEIMNTLDDSFLNQSISDWHTLPSVPGKSSLITNFKSLILNDIYLNLFDLSIREVITSPDVEYIPILMKLI